MLAAVPGPLFVLWLTPVFHARVALLFPFRVGTRAEILCVRTEALHQQWALHGGLLSGSQGAVKSAQDESAGLGSSSGFPVLLV